MEKVKLHELIEKPLSGVWGDEDIDGNGIPVLRTTNFTNNGSLSYSDVVTRKIVSNNLKDKYLRVGDILIEKSGGSDKQPVGRVVYFEGEENKYLFNNFTSILRVKNLETCFPKYLFYGLFSNYQQGGTRPYENKTTGLHNLKLEQYINSFEIPLPSLEEQKAIAGKLDKVSGLIEKRKTQLEKLDLLIKSRFIEMFGDGHDGKAPTKMLGSICKFQQGTQIPVEEQFEEQISGYKRFLRIIDYTQAPQPPRYVNANGKEVDEKSVVIVRYGATAGFVGRGYQGILANNLFEIMPDETILSKEFLFLALKYGTFEKEVHDKAFGAAMPALSFSMMNDIPVVVPMAEQQSQFVSFVEQTDKSKFEIQKSLEKLEILKKSLMQQYFG